MHIMRHQLTSVRDLQVQGQKNTLFFMNCRNSGIYIWLVNLMMMCFCNSSPSMR